MIGFTYYPSEYADFSYTVYRYLYDNEIPSSLNVKFDLTLLPPHIANNTISRTRGHYHLFLGQPPRQYFDIYQVHAGHIIFQFHPPPDEVSHVFFAEGKPGDIFVLPPHMCHVLYNTSDQVALVSNWCTRNEHLDYNSMQYTNGPAFDISFCSKNNLKLTINEHFKCKEVEPRMVRPVGTGHILRMLGFNSELIFDWAFEGNNLRMMNDPMVINDWVSKFFVNNKFSKCILGEEI
jgi:oxalate decarboxylase/phosphoglucose isomerase-like protein (cupin superfamily)